eukprot:g2572.t1
MSGFASPRSGSSRSRSRSSVSERKVDGGKRAAQLRLENFHVIDTIYRSQTGSVIKARRKGSRELFVLKKRLCSELGGRKDILNEVKLLKKVHNPNVIRCHDFFYDDSRGRRALYIVLEYAISAGIACLHENGIVHRDIKALNILRCEDDSEGNDVKYKVGDLGVGREMSKETHFLSTFYGTPLYASPELCESKPYDERTDIWSLGVLLYELITLRHPFQGANLIALGQAIRNAEYEELPGDCPEPLRHLVAAMLQKRMDRRPRAWQVQQMLEDIEVEMKMIDIRERETRAEKQPGKNGGAYGDPTELSVATEPRRGENEQTTERAYFHSRNRNGTSMSNDDSENEEEEPQSSSRLANRLSHEDLVHVPLKPLPRKSVLHAWQRQGGTKNLSRSEQRKENTLRRDMIRRKRIEETKSWRKSATAEGEQRFVSSSNPRFRDKQGARRHRIGSRESSDRRNVQEKSLNDPAMASYKDHDMNASERDSMRPQSRREERLTARWNARQARLRKQGRTISVTKTAAYVGGMLPQTEGDNRLHHEVREEAYDRRGSTERKRRSKKPQMTMAFDHSEEDGTFETLSSRANSLVSTNNSLIQVIGDNGHTADLYERRLGSARRSGDPARGRRYNPVTARYN